MRTAVNVAETTTISKKLNVPIMIDEKDCKHEKAYVNANWTALICEKCRMKFIGGDKAYQAELKRLKTKS